MVVVVGRVREEAETEFRPSHILPQVAIQQNWDLIDPYLSAGTTDPGLVLGLSAAICPDPMAGLGSTGSGPILTLYRNQLIGPPRSVLTPQFGSSSPQPHQVALFHIAFHLKTLHRTCWEPNLEHSACKSSLPLNNGSLTKYGESFTVVPPTTTTTNRTNISIFAIYSSQVFTSSSVSFAFCLMLSNLNFH